MKIKLNLLSFLQSLSFGDGEEGGGGGGVVSSPDTVSADTASSPDALAESGSESQSSVTDSEQQTASTGDDPLKDVPTIEELQEQVAQKVPYAQALAQLRPAYERTKQELSQFDAWKPLAEKQVDPSVALANHELVSLLHSPVEGKPDEYTTKPFLERLETESPGSVDQIFSDLLSYPVPGQDGKLDTLVRHLYRSHGLNPDNIAQYQALDKGTLGIASGIVSADDLAKIDPQFHDAFKALSPANRTDILTLLQSGSEVDRLNVAENLRNAQSALEAQKFREQIENNQKSQEQAQQQALEREIQSESTAAIEQVTSEIYNSIKQSLASQITVSSDPLINESYQAGVMSNLYTLLDPAGRKLILEPLLAKMGVSLDSTIAGVQVPFDQTVNRLAERTAAAKRYEKYGDQMRARQAMSEASQARQLLTAKLNQIALKLASPTANLVKGNGNAGATARVVPSGNGAQSKSGGNPFDLPAGVQPFSREADEHHARVRAMLSQN